jgi:cytosine/adenosine deaminase-related metal-dependent hydrolase
MTASDKRDAPAGPEDDAALPAFWNQLGIPGAIDLHVHFMPERVLRKVWAYCDEAETRMGMRWPIAYRLAEDDRVARLRAMGVRTFGALA